MIIKEEHSIKLRKRNWFYLFSANFLGVFNDNFLKNAIIFISMGWFLPRWLTSSQIIAAVSAALVLPYLIFSPMSGKLTSKYKKQQLFRFFKLIEIPIMIIAAIAFYFEWIFVTIFLVLIMGIVSCLYSPAKYSLIRDISQSDENSFGSGMIEAMAFLGILLGTLVASLLSDNYHFIILIFTFIAVAVLGYLSAYKINVIEEKNDNLNNFEENYFLFLKNNFLFAKYQPKMLQAIIGYAMFWTIAGLLQMNLIIHCKYHLHCNNSTIGIIMGVAAIGIIVGCTAAGRIVKNRFYVHSVFYSTAMISLFIVAIFIFDPSIILFAIITFFLAFAGGFFQVPCLASLQDANIGSKLGDTMAFLNFTTFLFVLIGTVLFSLITMLFNDNSFIVFGVMLLLSLSIFLYILIFYTKKRKKTMN